MKDKSNRFEMLVRSHTHELYSYAYGLCRDRHTAEDLVQETLLRAWKNLHALRDPRALKGWLYTILRREHARHYRANSRPHEELDEIRLPPAADFKDQTETYALRQAMHQLPESYREPLLLQVIGGFSCREIADILDLTPANVMARVSRARRKLRGFLQADESAGMPAREQKA